jgi:hypothetical protein
VLLIETSRRLIFPAVLRRCSFRPVRCERLGQGSALVLEGDARTRRATAWRHRNAREPDIDGTVASIRRSGAPSARHDARVGAVRDQHRAVRPAPEPVASSGVVYESLAGERRGVEM